MRLWMDVHSTYGEAVKTVCRDLRARAPERFERTNDWRAADVTVDLLVDSPIGTLNNVPRHRDADQHEWHREMLMRLTGGQRKALFPICSFEHSEVMRYACREANVVFSFLPDFPERLGETAVNWRLQPLGVAPTQFTPGPPWKQRGYDVYTWGFVAETEYIDRIARVCAQEGRSQLHSGFNFGWNHPTCSYARPAPRGQVAERYRQCRYANAMRLPYGYELAALEATLCGTRAICLDLMCYRHWFRDVVRYVSSGPSAEADIARILSNQDDEPSADERAWVAETYNWDRVAGLFWDAVEESL